MTTLNYSDNSQFQWRSAGWSAFFHIVSILILIALPVQVVRTIVEPRASVRLIAPNIERPAPPPPIAKKIVVPPQVVKNTQPPEVKLPVPQPVVRQPLPQRQQVIEPMAVPPPAPAPAPAVASIPKPALPARPQIKVQEGGFGEPIGTKETAGPSKLPLPAVGSFDLPKGAGNAPAKPGAVASSGFDNGVAGGKLARAAGGVKMGGFGDGPGGTGTGTDPAWRRGGSVQAGGFDAAPLPPVKTEKPRVEAAAVTPVEILFKPKPIYTDEARKARIEGEVLLKIIFAADKSLKVLEVTRRLGHGLDEAAVQAAQQIRFNPALREGTPVDFTANVRIFFQLAE